eukprot:m.258081 g.258081  ORF g.258081 m.258081 type:complete len:84 (-) comp15535_c0_seq8:131-382(-)
MHRTPILWRVWHQKVNGRNADCTIEYVRTKGKPVPKITQHNVIGTLLLLQHGLTNICSNDKVRRSLLDSLGNTQATLTTVNRA